jgi:endonuclease III
MKNKGFPKIKEIMNDIKTNYESIISRQTNASIEKDYEILIKKIVDSVENKKKLDEEAYNELTTKYPKIKQIVDDMIEQIKIFSIYDDDIKNINFNYSEYLTKISAILA